MPNNLVKADKDMSLRKIHFFLIQTNSLQHKRSGIEFERSLAK